MYSFRFGEMRFPITPSKLTIKVKGKNKTLTLANDGDMSFLRLPGLTEISFEATLPMLGAYSFSGKYYKPNYYLSIFENLMTTRTPFQFIVVRLSPSGLPLYDTNMKVSLEDYTVTEDAEKGPDVVVAISLKQYVEYKTKTVKVIVPESASTALPETASSASTETPVLVEETKRDASSAPVVKSHVVKAGDTLWLLAKKYYDNGAKYMKIYNANTDKLTSPNRIFVGQTLTIPDASAPDPVTKPKGSVEVPIGTKKVTVNMSSKQPMNSGTCTITYYINGALKSSLCKGSASVLVDAGTVVTIACTANSRYTLAKMTYDTQWKASNSRTISATIKSDSTVNIIWQKAL